MALVLPDGDEVLEVRFTVQDQEETITVTLAPETFSTVMEGMRWVRQSGLWEGQAAPDDMASLGLANYQLIQRIKDWRGPTDKTGKKAACTEANKMLFFGRYPNALGAIWEALGKRQEEQRKNSKPSRPG